MIEVVKDVILISSSVNFLVPTPKNAETDNSNHFSFSPVSILVSLDCEKFIFF